MVRGKTEQMLIEATQSLRSAKVGESVVIGRKLWLNVGHRVRAALALAKVAVWTTGVDSSTVQVTRVL
jgi:hypothetical protein